jgi:oligopeptide/dipeptide ABC transporter ATP-binding protein
MAELLEVRDLHTDIRLRSGTVRAVDGVSFSIGRGETLGLVGESGCGKTMTGMSILRLLPPGGRITSGLVHLEGHDLAGLDEEGMRRMRGNDVAMVFQDPMTSLNPVMTIGHQIAETVRAHKRVSRQAAIQRAEDVLGLVGIPRPAERLHEYPHQLSGGLRQRTVVAMALACEPRLIIADEPTTALDVTIQAQILDLLTGLKTRLSMGMLLVSHNMGIIAGQADRVLVMYAGKIVESGPTAEIFARPRHPYTEALLRSIPRMDQDKDQSLHAIGGMPPDLANLPKGCRFAARCPFAAARCREEEPVLGGDESHPYACFFPRHTSATEQPVPQLIPAPARPGQSSAAPGPLLELRRVVKEFPVRAGLARTGAGTVKAVSDVSLAVQPGETFGLVGESGCGKTTVGRLAVALERPGAGQVIFDGTDLARAGRAGLRRARRDLQLMFQDPYASLDPRMSVGSILREPLDIQNVGSRESRQARVAELLDAVRLPASAARRRPHEFSGGQRQRIGLARALALNPRLIVADEPVSALDMSIQAQVLNLMRELQGTLGLTYVIISHDLSVVRYMADRIGVMYLGMLMEVGGSADIYSRAAHPYTAGLIQAIPVPDPGREKDKPVSGVRGELPSAVHPPSGCRFRTRCPLAAERCAVEEPALTDFGPGHRAACHFPLQTPVPASPAGIEGGSV